jgi:hypothetical protein
MQISWPAPNTGPNLLLLIIECSIWFYLNIFLLLRENRKLKPFGNYSPPDGLKARLVKPPNLSPYSFKITSSILFFKSHLS